MNATSPCNAMLGCAVGFSHRTALVHWACSGYLCTCAVLAPRCVAGVLHVWGGHCARPIASKYLGEDRAAGICDSATPFHLIVAQHKLPSSVLTWVEVGPPGVGGSVRN